MKRWLAPLLLLLPLSAFAADVPEPAQMVERLHATLLDNMKQGDKLDCKAREKKLEPVLADTFDTPFIAHFILRKRWNDMSDAQRQRWTDTLSRLVLSSYASNFHSFGGESFVVGQTQDQGPAQRVVHARLMRGDGGDPVTFDYIFRKDQERWRLINVIADGVSDLALRTGQYDKLYGERGFDELVKWIEQQSAQDGC
jgi:phospholipid transport system substrate-binding protein